MVCIHGEYKSTCAMCAEAEADERAPLDTRDEQIRVLREAAKHACVFLDTLAGPMTAPGEERQRQGVLQHLRDALAATAPK